MPRYRITSPDGRSVVVEGNQAPTEQDIAAIFGQMPQQAEQKDTYSPLQKLAYTGRAAGEGALLGMGDFAGGYTNVLANDAADMLHGKDLATRAKGYGNFLLHSVAPGFATNTDKFKQGRKEFVREQNQFAEEHPVLNFGGELAGGLVTGVAGAGKKLAQTAGQQGLKALMGEGAREGAKFGLAYGAGSGLTASPDKLSVQDALIGGGTGVLGGAVLGAAIPGAVGGIGRILSRGPVESMQNVALKRIVAQNPELVQKSINEGTPLINIADKKLFRTTRGAVSTNPEAEQILSDYAKKFNEAKAGKVEDLINQQLGEKSSAGVVQDIIEEGRRVYKPIYDEVMKAGDLQIPIKNQRVLNAFGEVLKDYPELDKLPATDIRVLDLVKQKLDDKIGVAVRQGENNKARMLLQAKNELVSQIDAKVPQYTEARKAFKAMKDLEELVSQGQSVKQLGREELAQLYQKTAPEERGAIKAGIRDVLIRDLDSINSKGANAVKKVFSNSMLGKLKRIGLSDDQIAQAIAREDLANSNIQGVFGGSNTAQKIVDILNNTQGGTVGNAVFRPVRTAKRYGIKAVDYLVNKIQNSSPAETARLMTDPAYLKSEYNRVYGKVADIAKGGKGQSGISNIVNKLKEEGGFAMKPLEGGSRITEQEAQFIASRPKEEQNAIYDALVKKHEAEEYAAKVRAEKVEKERLAKEAIAKEKQNQLLEKWEKAEVANAEKAQNETLEEYLARKGVKAKRGPIYELHKYDWEQAQASKPSISSIIKNKLKEEGGYAMKPLNDTQIAYHGTGVRGIKQLDTAYMGKGEGPQAHGWGTYLAKPRETAERYRSKLMNKEEINKIQAKYDPLLEQASKEAQGKYEKLYELWQNGKITGEEYSKKVDEVSKKEWELLRDRNREIDKLLATENAEKGQVYEVEIPSDDFLLDEGKHFGEQPKRVQEAINKLREKYPNIRTGHKGLWIYKDVVREGPYKTANQNKRWASETLNKYGIKGIAYDGRQDGRSFVIFNPMKDTKINRTFYSVLAALASAGLLNDKERK